MSKFAKLLKESEHPLKAKIEKVLKDAGIQSVEVLIVPAYTSLDNTRFVVKSKDKDVRKQITQALSGKKDSLGISNITGNDQGIIGQLKQNDYKQVKDKGYK
jgi:hypothetical protein